VLRLVELGLPNLLLISSGDAAGASVAEQKSRYDDAVSNHPSTILSLQHEVKGA